MKVCAHGLVFAGLCLAGGGLLCGSALAQNGPAQNATAATAGTLPAANIDTSPIGKVLSVSGAVTIDHTAAVVVQANLPTNGTIPTKTGDLVFRGDIIQTGSDGALGVSFADGTSFNVSSNARMAVDQFVYDPKGHSNSSLLSLTKGTFTFIAGNIAHTGDMKVDTPVGTMGIRGTAPRVEIAPDGTTKFSTLIEHK